MLRMISQDQQRFAALSFNGRTRSFDLRDIGSNPIGAANPSYPTPAR